MVQRALLLIALLFSATLFPFVPTAWAQVSEQVAVTLTPANPGPNERVTIRLQSYSFDLDTAAVEWSRDGKLMSSNIGLAEHTFTTKGLGVSTVIVAKISPIGYPVITKTIEIVPMSVDLLWEATDSVVPPFYRGKAMPTSESAVRFFAVPQIRASNGALLAPSAFVYDWRENYSGNAAKSGYAKSGYVAAMDYLNPEKRISVQVSTRDGGASAAGDIVLRPVQPKLVLYAASPLYGPLYGRALDGGYVVEGSDTSIVAMPYFFSPRDPASPLLKYTWKINGEAIAAPGVPNSLFLHRDSEEKGTAQVELAVENPRKLFQELKSTLTLSLQ